MKKIILTLTAISIAFTLFAQDIKLPTPRKTGGKPLMECLAARHSTKSFDSSKKLDKQTISNILWAAWGYNRADKRTAPSSRNKQEMDIYVALPEGMYLWDAKQNILKLVVKADQRKATGKQDYVENASANFVFVCNIDKADVNGNNQKLTEATYANAGFISQNIYLYCASEGLGTVVRGYVPKDELAKKMKLNKKQMIVLAQSIGYPAK